jgi:thiol-disulfide isomerase/thioredoxin
LKEYLTETFEFEKISNKLKYASYHKYFNKLDKKPELTATYYDFTNQIDLNKEPILAKLERSNMVSDLLGFWASSLYEKDTTKDYDSLQMSLIDSKLKGDLKDAALSKEIFNVLAYEFNVEKASKLEERFANDLKNQSYKKEIQDLKMKVKKYAKGAIAPTFSYPDMNGKMVSLSDFKGKVVYLDVWASWCGPCRREIPAAKELEKQMHGKDVVFLCVSVDGDEAAWKKIVKEKELTGVHIHSKGDFKSEMTKLYDINSIPTYIIIDRNGKIWKMGAERPSGKAKEELEEALKN